MKVSEWMTPDVVVVAPTTPASECRQLLRTCGVRQLPVVDEGKLVGCVHDVALLGEQPENATAGDLLEPPFTSATPHEAMADAVTRWSRWMEEAMFVVEGGHVVGVITEHDLCRRGAELLPETLTARDVANAPATIDSLATVSDARDQMKRGLKRHLIVVDRGRLLGVISRRDLVPGRRGDQPLFEVIAGPIQWTTGWDNPLRDVAATFVRHQVGCLPVVSDEDLSRVEGVVCRSDIVSAMLRHGLLGQSEVTP